MAVRRYDSGEILRVVKTPQGGIRVEAALTRSGVFEYQNPDGSIRREYRPEDEVFREDSIAQLEDAPVTHEHPTAMVTPETWDDARVVGHVATPPKREGDKIVAYLTVQHADTIQAIQSRKLREVSCGYLCDLDMTPGETPDGERYDAIQRAIKYNHVALVHRGRAGRDVALRLDHSGDQSPITEDNETMKIIERIDGVEYEVGTDSHAAAVQARADSEAETQAELDRLRALEESLHLRVHERVQLVQLAEKHGVSVDAEHTDAAVRENILRALVPGIDLEGRSETYIEARLDAAIEASKSDGDAAQARETIEGRKDVDDISVDVFVPRDVQARMDSLRKLREINNNPSRRVTGVVR